MAAQSKLIETAINCSCHEYLHPWTTSCVAGGAGILLAAIPSSMRTYTVVYLLGLLMKMRIPRVLDIQHTITGIIKSTAFLSTNAYMFSLWVCLLRQMLGRFYLSTVAFVPTFLGSYAALCFERPERRTPLALYVANLALESLWNMMEARGLVRSIPNGHVFLFGCSLSALLYMYRLGVHKTKVKDVTFKALRIFIGNDEEGEIRKPIKKSPQSSSQPPLNFSNISAYVQLYDRLRKAKHSTCPHREGCVPYALMGGLKPFLGGIGLQVGLKIVLNITKIFKIKMDWRKQIFNKGSLNLGLAFGSFSLIFKAISCGLRNACGCDSAIFAIPAGLLGSIGLLQYPNITISLYVMWKAMHMLYNWGIKEGFVPEIPHFNMILYSVCTAVLFHCAIMEPKSLRSSYYRFLMTISGKRISLFDRKPLAGFGLRSHEQTAEVLKKLNINITPLSLPIAPMSI